MGALWAKYRPLIVSRIAEGTARAYDVAWRTRVRPRFGDVPVSAITALDVELAFAEWPGKPSTKVDALAMLSAVCRVAVKGGLIASNPCQGIERPRGVAYEPASRALTVDEVPRLLAVLPESGPYRRFVLAMLYTGCRLGEVAALSSADVDLERRVVVVQRTASPGVTGARVIGPTKGRRTRAVPILDGFRPILEEAMAGKGAHEPIFTGPNGGYITSKNLSRALSWHAVRDQVKTFPPGEPALHWHDLRHSFAVMAFRAGVPAPDVQALLGHATLAVTQLYADTRNEAARRAIEPLSALFASLPMRSTRGGENVA